MDDKYYLIRYKYNLKLFLGRQRLKKDVCIARLNFSGADTTSIMIRMKMALGDLDYMVGKYSF